ncbi:MAG: GMC family oxidoreductase [Candidatus Lernaella stagnicola]|nr:GMC family oxidoreductase [Candidatus Lernaella stagnicola]
MIEHADVVIIGSGAGGGTVGAELAEAGYKVVFLEAGKDLNIEYGSPDHFANRQRFLDTVNDGLFWHEEYTGRNWRTDMGECAGGGTTCYAGVLEESTPEDFNAGLWPFSWEEFQPYFELTKKRYHVYRWPLEELSHYAQVVNEAAGDILGPIQSGFNREPYFEYGVYHDRCRQCRCCLLGCRYNAKANATTIALPKAKWYGAEVRENCWVTRLNTNPAGTKVTSVTYLKRTTTGVTSEHVEEHEIIADRYILAAGSMMTPMLLHWSGRKGETLANSSGQVGRNLRGHFFRATYAVMKRDDVRTYQGNLVELNDLYQNWDKGYLLEFNMAAPPTYLGGMVEVMEKEDLLDMIGLKFKRIMRNYSKMIVSAPLTRSFDDGFTENSIMPHPTRENRYGDPLPVVDFEPNAQELAWVDTATAAADDIILAAGGDPEQMFHGGIDVVHKVGTCRMGTDPKDSVADVNGQVWDMDNLWIADGSLFPAPLLANCAFIIYCLGYKVADGILGRSTPTV